MKRMIFLLTVLLLSLTACSNGNDSIYTIKLGGRTDGYDIFKDKTPCVEISSYVSHKNEQESPLEKLHIGEKMYEAKQTEKLDWAYQPDWEVYLSEDEEIEISIIENEGGFVISTNNIEGVVEEFPEDALTEESLLEFAKTFVTQHIDNINFDKYEITVKSGFSCSTDNSNWSENREGFYPYDSENENEYVQRYYVLFDEFCNDIETENEIMLIFDVHGNIRSCRYIDYDVDWSSFTVDEEEVAAAVDYFVDEYVNAGGYKELSYEVKNQKLGWSGEEIYLAVEVEIRYYESTVSDGKYLSSGYEGERKKVATLVLTQ